MSIDITTLAIAKEYTNRMIGSGGAGSIVNGKDGITPHIGDNGNWFIGTTDTGVSAEGEDGGHYIPVVTQPSSDKLQISFTPSKSDMPAVNPVTVTLPVSEGSGENANQVEPAWSDIPKIFFGDPLQQTKDEIVTTFSYRSKTMSLDCYAEIKAQGNSTMMWPKKNQTVKLFADVECTEKLKINFKGWGKQNKFVLKAYWTDLTHLRDVVSVRLEGDCMCSRSDFDKIPELLRTSPNLGGTDGFPVVVYAAGVYQGRYMLNIPKDKWMANMDDDLNTHCILCSEGGGSSLFRAVANIDGNDWTDEIHDTVPASILARWNEVIDFVRSATDEEFVTNLDSYININSLIDRHIMGLYSCDYDGYAKNQLYLTYDGKIWYASRYDKDGTWGTYWTGSMVSADYGRDQYEDIRDGRAGNLLFIRLEHLLYKRLQDRWEYLKNHELSLPNTINRFRELSDITPPHLIAEDYATTTANGAFTGIPNKTTCTIQQIQTFAVERRVWMDEYMASLTPVVAVPCTGISLSAESLTFIAEGAQVLTATVTPDGCTDPITWRSDNSSVATVADGVVTAVANGTANIIASCGDYSASCAVSVSGVASGIEEGTDPPADYERLAYIESSGTQVIDTGVQGGSNAAYEIRFNPLGVRASTFEQYFAGDAAATTPKLYANGSDSLMKLVLQVGASGVEIADNTDAIYTVGYNLNGDASAQLDGNTITDFTGKINSGWGSKTWYVFGSSSEDRPSIMRLYYLKMWAATNALAESELVRFFVPVRRTSDNVIGLWDRVTATFYENIGTGEFTGV